MTRWPDEEPDVDERGWDEAHQALQTFAVGLCERCGHEDHESKDCPNVTPDLLRDQWGKVL